MKLTQITAGTIAIVASLAVVLIVGVGELGRMAEKRRDIEARSVENGAAAWGLCEGCHGPQGKGIPGVAPALNSAYFFTQRLSDLGYTGNMQSYVESTISAGRPASTEYSARMPTWGQEFGGPLRPDQVRDLAAFVMNWEATALSEGTPTPAPIATPVPEGASPEEKGQALFLSLGCGGCHTIDNVSAGAVGPNLNHVGTEAATMVDGQSAEEYIHASIVNPSAFIAPGCPTGNCIDNLMPKDYGDKLSQDELGALVAYLLSLK